MVVVIATTSIELIIGFLVVLWRRSSDKTSRVVKQLAVPLKEEEDEFEVASGKTRVTIFSGTQTGTAEEGAMTTCIPAGTDKLHFRVWREKNVIKPTTGKRRCNCRNEVYQRQSSPRMFQQITEQSSFRSANNVTMLNMKGRDISSLLILRKGCKMDKRWFSMRMVNP